MYKKFEIGNRMIVFKTYLLDKGVKGIKSNCKDGKHVLFIDLDNINPKWLEQRIKEMMKRFKLSDVYVFVTKENSFHVICLDKFTKGEIIDIQSWFDQALTYTYQIYGIKRDGWVLRTSEKHNRYIPKYFMTIRGSCLIYHKQSSAHAEWLREYYKVPVKLRNPDKLKVLTKDNYPTVVKNV